MKGISIRDSRGLLIANAQPAVVACDESGDRGAQILGLVELRRASGKASKESEHLRSLARRCQRLAKEIADAEMARLFRTMGADYHRRAGRLAVMGR